MMKRPRGKGDGGSRCVCAELGVLLDQGDFEGAQGVLRRARAGGRRPELPRGVTEMYHLTPAEHRVMAFTVRGQTNQEIADRLGLSRNTVRNRLAAAFAKLGVSRRAEAVSVLLGFQGGRRYLKLKYKRTLPQLPPSG